MPPSAASPKLRRTGGCAGGVLGQGSSQISCRMPQNCLCRGNRAGYAGFPDSLLACGRRLASCVAKQAPPGRVSQLCTFLRGYRNSLEQYQPVGARRIWACRTTPLCNVWLVWDRSTTILCDEVSVWPFRFSQYHYYSAGLGFSSFLFFFPWRHKWEQERTGRTKGAKIPGWTQMGFLSGTGIALPSMMRCGE